jgi:Tfp pilus assembly protein PilF
VSTDSVRPEMYRKRSDGFAKLPNKTTRLRNNLGTLLLGKGETEKAKACYRKAVELGFTMAAPLAQ